jgi:hypothetical protein
MRFLLLLSLSLLAFGCGSTAYHFHNPDKDGCTYVLESTTGGLTIDEKALLWCCKDVCKEAKIPDGDDDSDD